MFDCLPRVVHCLQRKAGEIIYIESVYRKHRTAHWSDNRGKLYFICVISTVYSVRQTSIFEVLWICHPTQSVMKLSTTYSKLGLTVLLQVRVSFQAIKFISVVLFGFTCCCYMCNFTLHVFVLYRTLRDPYGNNCMLKTILKIVYYMTSQPFMIYEVAVYTEQSLCDQI